MNTKTKLEQVLELVINEETDKASDLLHDIFVEKSRSIYADLIEEDASVEEVIEEEEYSFEEDVEEDAEEIEAEESAMTMEDEDEDDAEMELADELVGDEEGGEEEMSDGSSDRAEDAMMNVEDALDELKAAFAELTGGEAGETETDMDMEMDMDMEDEVEEDYAFESEDLEEETEELDEAAKLSAVNVTHADGTDNTKSTVAGKNDMGGSAKNIAQGSAEEKGRAAPTGASLGVDGPQEAGNEPRTVKK